MNPHGSASAIQRELTEIYLIEQYHWLPQDIMNIPYSWIQKYLIITGQRDSAKQKKEHIEQFNAQNKSTGSGQMRRFYREV